MFIYRDYSTTLWIAFIILLVIIASVVIPYYKFKKKRWKGLAMGCLIQPFACAIASFAILIGIFLYELWVFDKQKDKAMVTVRTLEKKGDRVDTLIWYVKPDEECLMERLRQGHDDDEAEYRDSTETERDIEWFDVVPIENFPHGVNIEDRIMVRFDLKNHSVVATDYDDRAEVTEVDWDKVRDFFAGKGK